LLFCKFVTCGVLKIRQKYNFEHPTLMKAAMLRRMEGARLEWQIANDGNYFDEDKMYTEITDLYFYTSSMEIRNSFTVV